MKIQQVCVIGAGISGLVAAKTFIEDGYDVTVFEKQKGLGGVWEQSRTYPGLTTQNTRDTFAFSDYPMPVSYPEWPTAEQMRNYLESYAESFGVKSRIHFDAEVINVQSKGEGQLGWVVTVKVPDTQEKVKKQTYEFDFVMICNGTHSIANTPSIPGKEEFIASGGKILHSSELNDLDAIADKKVVVVGFGKSATDIATLTANQAKECTLVFRSALWKMPKFFLNRINIKYILLTRFSEAWFPYRKMPKIERLLHSVGKPLVWSFWRTNEMLLKKQLPMEACGMIPDRQLNELDCSAQLVNENFYNYVRSGKIRGLKTTIAKFLPDGVELASGARLQADVVIFGTGFRQDIPFLEDKYRQMVIDKQNYFHLYRHLIHPDIPQMGFVGYTSSLFSQLTSEVGAWWLLEYIKGNITLPSHSQMSEEMEAELEWIKTQLPSHKASGSCISPFSLRYVDQLMEDMGATSKQSVWKGISQIMNSLDPSLYSKFRQELAAQRKKNV